MTRRGGEEGSTLLEVLVAFVIMAGAVILSFRIFGDGVRGVEMARERSMMAAIARRELARLEVSPALAAGHIAGKDDQGFVWSIEVSRRGDAKRGGDAVVPFEAKVMVGRASSPAVYPVSVETVLLAVPQR